MNQARHQTAVDVCHMTARDGTRLAYRWFPADDNGHVLVCLHGSFFEGSSYINLARLCRAHGVAVCVPDWRGHGASGGRFGEVRYRGQLEDDVRDLVAHLVDGGVRGIVLGGHSSGGQVALRYLIRHGSAGILGYFSIAPPLAVSASGIARASHAARMAYALRYLRSSPHAGAGESSTQTFPRLHPVRYGLSVLFPPLRGLPVLTFGKPDDDSGRVPGYTARLTDSINLPGIPRAYSAIDVPCHLFAGDRDDAIGPEQLDVIRQWYVPPSTPTRLSVLAGANHMTAISAAAKPLAAWAKERIEHAGGAAGRGE